MKKMKKFLVFLLVITMVVLPIISVNASCEHPQQYWDIYKTITYQYIDGWVCRMTEYWDVECKICAETWVSGPIISDINHNWVREDLGHVPNEALHIYRNSCTQCGYSFITEEFCGLIH